MMLTMSVFTYGQSNLSKIYRDCYILNVGASEKALTHFKSLKPDSYAISFCIANSKFAQRKDMLVFYKASKPSADDVKWLKANCPFVKRNW